MRSTTQPRPPAVRDGFPATERERFLDEVLRGLRQPVKELPCKYFYDDRGSRLFDRICELEEYYLTRTELAIMRAHGPAMAARLGPGCLLVEFGSGSSIKTRILLDHLPAPAAYIPVDIARGHLTRSARALAALYPGLVVRPVAADFTAPFELPTIEPPPARTVVYFPGSTIGNFHPDGVVSLLGRIATLVGPGGGLLIGVDLEKDRATLESAYNDREGVTRAFNLNLLARINRELGADFAPGQFDHRAVYNADAGRIEMHLVSRRAQAVAIDGTVVAFAHGESIRTECSYKYSLETFSALADGAGLRVRDVWTDERRLFSVQYLTAG